MKTRRINTQSMVAAAAIGSLLFLGGCGTSTPGSDGNTSPEGASASASPSPSFQSPTTDATGAASQAPSSSAEATPSTEPNGGASETTAAAPPATTPEVTASPATAREATAPAVEPVPTTDPTSPDPTSTDPIANRCTANMLTGEIINAPGGGAAGSVYRHLVLINTGSKDCVLHGWAGVSYVADGAQVGAAAERDPQQVPVTNILAPGQAAAAPLQETRAQNYTDCSPVGTTGIRVYPPEDTSSLIIAHQSTGCANASIKLLTIGTFEPFSLAQ